MSVNQPRNKDGKFGRAYVEPRGKAIALRLPESIDREARKLAGEDLVEFNRKAVAEKVEWEKDRNSL